MPIADKRLAAECWQADDDFSASFSGIPFPLHSTEAALAMQQEPRVKAI
jgi:hypothetical protein